jgi:hypothetical protein
MPWNHPTYNLTLIRRFRLRLRRGRVGVRALALLLAQSLARVLDQFGQPGRGTLNGQVHARRPVYDRDGLVTLQNRPTRSLLSSWKWHDLGKSPHSWDFSSPRMSGYPTDAGRQNAIVSEVDDRRSNANTGVIAAVAFGSNQGLVGQLAVAIVHQREGGEYDAKSRWNRT